jgi:hypothetical protein
MLYASTAVQGLHLALQRQGGVSPMRAMHAMRATPTDVACMACMEGRVALNLWIRAALATIRSCGFNRSMQQFGDSVLLVFRSLGSF